MNSTALVPACSSFPRATYPRLRILTCGYDSRLNRSACPVGQAQTRRRIKYQVMRARSSTATDYHHAVYRCRHAYCGTRTTVLRTGSSYVDMPICCEPQTAELGGCSCPPRTYAVLPGLFKHCLPRHRCAGFSVLTYWVSTSTRSYRATSSGAPSAGRDIASQYRCLPYTV